MTTTTTTTTTAASTRASDDIVDSRCGKTRKTYLEVIDIDIFWFLLERTTPSQNILNKAILVGRAFVDTLWKSKIIILRSRGERQERGGRRCDWNNSWTIHVTAAGKETLLVGTSLGVTRGATGGKVTESIFAAAVTRK